MCRTAETNKDRCNGNTWSSSPGRRQRLPCGKHPAEHVAARAHTCVTLVGFVRIWPMDIRPRPRCYRLTLPRSTRTFRPPPPRDARRRRRCGETSRKNNLRTYAVRRHRPASWRLPAGDPWPNNTSRAGREKFFFSGENRRQTRTTRDRTSAHRAELGLGIRTRPVGSPYAAWTLCTLNSHGRTRCPLYRIDTEPARGMHKRTSYSVCDRSVIPNGMRSPPPLSPKWPFGNVNRSNLYHDNRWGGGHKQMCLHDKHVYNARRLVPFPRSYRGVDCVPSGICVRHRTHCTRYGRITEYTRLIDFTVGTHSWNESIAINNVIITLSSSMQNKTIFSSIILSIIVRLKSLVKIELFKRTNQKCK